MSDRRLNDLIRFYSILNQLEKAIGAARALADCRGRMKWPSRGVYFFHETGGHRGSAPRFVVFEPVQSHTRLLLLDQVDDSVEHLGRDRLPFCQRTKQVHQQ